MSRLISPSILSADFNNLGKDILMLNQSEADWIHFDVMDGVFVPNISFGLPVIQHVKKIATKPLDVHLMIINPDPFIKPFKDSGADILTVHFEVCNHLHRTVDAIRQEGMKAGVCLNPATPVHFLEDIINEVDMILLMSVNPGFGGQKFIQNTIQKVIRLRRLIEEKQANVLIEIDGGVNFETGKRLFDAGADVLVAGSFVFGAEDPKLTIHQLKNV
ncbi:MAG: ribulose-phosphate 3-epimerase [Bacteroidia bacterium]|nr:ribulose-phosphate 3-epimerase [Bacteroidia bacterium]